MNNICNSCNRKKKLICFLPFGALKTHNAGGSAAFLQLATQQICKTGASIALKIMKLCYYVDCYDDYVDCLHLRYIDKLKQTISIQRLIYNLKNSPSPVWDPTLSCASIQGGRCGAFGALGILHPFYSK